MITDKNELIKEAGELIEIVRPMVISERAMKSIAEWNHPTKDRDTMLRDAVQPVRLAWALSKTVENKKRAETWINSYYAITPKSPQ